MRRGQMHWTDILFNTVGRLRRRDFWVWFLVKTIAIPLIAIAGMALVMALKLDKDTESLAAIGILTACAATFGVSSLALICKRWHDRNKTGWMYLILFTPFVGWLWTLIECGFIDGTPGRNRYGRSPKGLGEEPSAF